MTTKLLTCAKAPCKSCPYRRDVPSGIWHPSEYRKLRKYDGDIIDQLTNGAIALFDCHQKDGRLCAGWIGAHGAHNLLAVSLNWRKLAKSVFAYTSPIPLFATGREAARHGMRDIRKPDAPARRMIDRLLVKARRT